ncbi:MAG: DUF1801 domain-containing protein [Chitinophagaceae bacterium]
MKNAAITTVDDYIAGFPPPVRKLLLSLRKTIKAAAPKAEELISYQMPAYKYKGVLVYFAAFEKHIGFYATPTGHATFKKELANYKTGKGSVQFPITEPLPLDLVKKIVQFRVKENEAKAAGKSVALKSKPAKRSDEELVNEWLNKLEAPVKKEIEVVRKIIKSSSSKLRERIKWNAPSYYYKEDILTFGPYQKDGRILLVLHHPAVVKIKSALLQGEYKDRRLVYFNNSKEAAKNKKELARIISEIIKTIDKK